MKKIYVLAGMFFMVFLAACSGRPIEPYSKTFSANYYTADQVKDAIIEGGRTKGWIMTPASAGVVNGHLSQRSHQVDVRVSYSTSGFTVEYVGSENLNAKNGKIHRKYAAWVNNLNEAIMTSLSAQPTKR